MRGEPAAGKPTRSAVTDDAGALALANMPDGVYDVERLLPEAPFGIGTRYPRSTVYRDNFRNCPACSARLEQARSVWRCAACRGCWVEERILADMVQRMRDGRGEAELDFTPRVTTEQVRPCPACSGAMAHVDLEGVPVDRCADHGIWFDEAELQAALHTAGLNRPPDDNDASYLRPSGARGSFWFWGSIWSDFD